MDEKQMKLEKQSYEQEDEQDNQDDEHNWTGGSKQDEIFHHHSMIIEILRGKSRVSDKLRSQMNTFENDDRDDSILQRIVQEMQARRLSCSNNVKEFIQWILKEDPHLLYQGNDLEKSLLHLASQCETKLCLKLMRLFFEECSADTSPPDEQVNGSQKMEATTLNAPVARVKKPLIDWARMMSADSDSCLHTAIMAKKIDCAMYLVQRIKADGVEKIVLGHEGRRKHTPLIVAAAYEYLVPESEVLVKELIEAFPDALFGRTIKTGFSSDDTEDLPVLTPTVGNIPLLQFYKMKDDYASKQTRQNQYRHSSLQQTKTKQESQKFVADKIEALLKLSCLRNYSQERHGPIKDYLPKNVGQIHLDLTPREDMSLRLLDRLMKIRKFEDVLLYVSIPNLRLESSANANGEDATNKGWYTSKRRDFVHIFNWLRKNNVRRILRIKVDDNDENAFHSDEAIEAALSGFEVESWDWKRADICSNVLITAAPSVSHLTLYWSGNNTTLRSWAAEDGLAQLRELRDVTIIRQKVIESSHRHDKNRETFMKTFEESWKKNSHERALPTIKITDTHGKQTREDVERREKEQKEEWIRQTDEFAKTLRMYLMNHPEKSDEAIKVAVIDDGANLDDPSIWNNIEDGESFQNDGDSWEGWYQSPRNHGTLMARIICRICPNVKLYISRLNEEWVNANTGFQITADSAAEAIDWARNKGVDIISMSWTIESVPEKSKLERAVQQAVNDDILLFCASNDSGNQSGARPYPACFPSVFCIGAATALGRMEDETQPHVQYLFPGTDIGQSDTSKKTAAGTVANVPKGSSIATARCVGFAAAILQSIYYNQGQRYKNRVRKYSQMENIFDRLKQNKYIPVSRVLQMMPPRVSSDHEWDKIKIVSEEFLRYSELEQRN